MQSHIADNRPIFGPVNAKAAEYGIAQFRQARLKGYTVEPLFVGGLVEKFPAYGYQYNDSGSTSLLVVTRR